MMDPCIEPSTSTAPPQYYSFPMPSQPSAPSLVSRRWWMVAAFVVTGCGILAFHPHATINLPVMKSGISMRSSTSTSIRTPVTLAAQAGASGSAFDKAKLDVWGDDDEEEEEELAPEELEAAMKALDDIQEQKKRQLEESSPKAETVVVTSEDPAKDYVPKVPTWGIFERPKDISKAYGGGRNIKAGQSVSREEAEKRRAELQGLISKLKQGDGVSPALMVEAQNNLTKADRLLEKQNYAQAEYLLRCVRLALPYRNRLAGRATLELGTVMDAQGRYLEAAELYKSLTKHPDGAIRKQANRLAESFEALRFFHYSNISNDRTWSNTIQPLLRSFASRSSVAVKEYHATPEDLALEKETAKAAYVAIGALFLVPIGMVACLSTVTY